MDLPTYTSIWRIEKRLYKLYDFRLPMPLPIGQVTVFVAIGVPYVVILTMLGVPFNHTLIWLYLLPPGAATWLVTRPVLESKRLPELVRSQLRYLAEPRVLCRLAPLVERDHVIVTGRVWRPRVTRKAAAAAAARAAAAAASEAEMASAVAVEPVAGSADDAVVARPPRPRLGPGRSRTLARLDAERTAFESAAPEPPAAEPPPAEPPVTETQAAEAPAAEPPPPAEPPPAEPRPAEAPPAETQAAEAPAADAPPAEPPPAEPPAEPPPAEAPAAVSPDPETDSALPAEPALPADEPRRPVVTVVTAGAAQSAPPSVEQALAGPAARRGDVRAARVTVVPGGHRPGKPDLLQRDRSRAQLPIASPARVVVLGCTVGAGQTITTLLAGEALAGLRAGTVAVLDCNPGPAGLARRAEARPALGQAGLLTPSRLVVVSSSAEPDHTGRRDPAAHAAEFAAAGDTYELVLADPATASVPRLLTIADQVILIAPASAAAPGAIAMTFEWLQAHGHGGLAAGAIMVLNGVSRRTLAFVEQAERVCAGRCRAVVRVPWDDQIRNHSAKRPPLATVGQKPRPQWAGALTPATAGAYTALAGVLVASLNELARAQAAARQPAPTGQVRP